MERSLLLGVFVLGVVGWVAGVLAGSVGPSRIRRIPIGVLIVSVVVPVLVLLLGVAMPRAGAAQRAWAEAFLIGGVGALLAVWTLLAAQSPSSPTAGLRWASPRFMALAALTAAVLWLGESTVDGLVGVITGWCVITGVLWAGLRGHGVSEEMLDDLIAAAGFVVTAGAFAGLGRLHESEAETLRWTSAALAFGAGLVFLSAVTGFARRGLSDSRRSPLVSLLIVVVGAALVLVLGWLVGERVIGQSRLLPASGIGLALGALLWALHRERGRSEPEEPLLPSRVLTDGLVGALVVLGAYMGAFYLLAGFGVGAALLAAGFFAALIATPTQPGSGSPDMPAAPAALSELTAALWFGSFLLLYRLFVSRFFADLAGPALTDHFAIFGILAGAIMPWILSSLAGGTSLPAVPSTQGVQLARAIVALVFAAALPLALVVLWGAKIVPGLLAGLALSSVAVAREGRRSAIGVVLFGTIVALLLTQWTQDIAGLAALTRAERVRVLSWIVGAALVTLVVADYAARKMARPPVTPRSAGPTSQEGL